MQGQKLDPLTTVGCQQHPFWLPYSSREAAGSLQILPSILPSPSVPLHFQPGSHTPSILQEAHSCPQRVLLACI